MKSNENNYPYIIFTHYTKVCTHEEKILTSTHSKIYLMTMVYGLDIVLKDKKFVIEHAYIQVMSSRAVKLDKITRT